MTNSHATARGLQLPICSIDQRGLQSIVLIPAGSDDYLTLSQL